MTTPNNVPSQSPAPRNWWQRNWKWFVPTGCLTLIGLFVAFIAVIVFVVFGAMKSSDAYQLAVTRAKSDPRVVAALGSPIKEGLFLSGNINGTGGSGQTDLTIPISGPKGKATLYAVGTKTAGEWHYTTLTVRVDGTGQAINLVADE